ncbi:MAG: hypothetical protein J6Z80_01305 [Clostridia bacterium]|nr:hypothetical protein [Clostridia bacterium]
MTEITENIKVKRKSKTAPIVIISVSVAVLLAAAAGIYAFAAFSVPDYAKEANEAFGMLFPDIASAAGDVGGIYGSENVSENADFRLSADATGLKNDFTVSVSGRKIGNDSEKEFEMTSGKASVELRTAENMTRGKADFTIKMKSGGNDSYFRRAVNDRYYFLMEGAAEKLDNSPLNPEKNDGSPLSPEGYGLLRMWLAGLESRYTEKIGKGEKTASSDIGERLVRLISDNSYAATEIGFSRDFSAGIIPDKILTIKTDGDRLKKLSEIISAEAEKLTGTDAAYYLDAAELIESVSEFEPIVSVSLTDRRGRLVSVSLKAESDVPDLPDDSGTFFSMTKTGDRMRASLELKAEINYGENWLFGAGKNRVRSCTLITDYSFVPGDKDGPGSDAENGDPEEGRAVLTVSRDSDRAFYEITAGDAGSEAKATFEIILNDGSCSFGLTDGEGTRLVVAEGKYSHIEGEDGERSAEFSVGKLTVPVLRKTFQKSAGGKKEQPEELTFENPFTYRIVNRCEGLSPSPSDSKFLFGLTKDEVGTLFGDEYYPPALGEFFAEVMRKSEEEMISGDGYYLVPPESYRSVGKKYAEKYAEALNGYNALFGYIDGSACMIRCYDEGTGVWYVLTYDPSLRQALAHVYVDMTPDLTDATRSGAIEDGLFTMDDDLTHGRSIPELRKRVDSLSEAIDMTRRNVEKIISAVKGGKTVGMKSVKDYGTPGVTGRPAYDGRNGTVAVPVGLGVYVYRPDGRYVGRINPPAEDAALNSVVAGDGCFIIAPEHGSALQVFDSATLKKTGEIEIPYQMRMVEMLRDGNMIFVRCETCMISVDLRDRSVSVFDEYDETTGMAIDRKNHRLAVTSCKKYVDNDKKGLYVSYYDTVTGQRVSEQDQAIRTASNMMSYDVSFNGRAFVITGPGMLTVGELTENGLRRAAAISGFSGVPRGYGIAYVIETGAEDIRAALLAGPGFTFGTLFVRDGGSSVVVNGCFDYVCPCGDTVVLSGYGQNSVALIKLGD